jgi:hypothetical protein
VNRFEGPEETSAVRLLMRVFLRRLIDNDLISPHADRHESLAVLCAMVVSVAVFVTFFVSTNYLAAFIQLPGPTALSALSDRFLFISASMAVSALAALMAWDALALETLDAAILGPLPISARTIIRAKLAAVLVFGAVLAVALNAVPSVLYPAFLTINMRGMSASGLLRLIAAHAMTMVMAGLFGFFGILAVRGILRLVLRESGFGRVSSAVQSALVVSSVIALLLAPTVRAAGLRDWVGGVISPRWPAVPVLWYLGVNETIAGHIVADTPVVTPPRVTLVTSLKREDEAGRAAYRELKPQFAALARWAWLSLPLAATLAIASFLRNNRRLPDRSAAGPAPSSRHAVTRRMAERLSDPNPEMQAGLFFTLQALARSAPHRTIVAISLAAGLTLPIITLVRSDIHRIAIPSMPLGFFAMDIMVLSALLAGFRYAVTVPAELASNWTIRMAWLGDERGYLAGTKAAGVIVLVIVPLLSLLPLHILLFGPVTAVIHSLLGLLFATATLDGMFLGYRKLPFACSHVPIENPRLLWPAAAASFLVVAYSFGYIERFALQTLTGTAVLGAILGAIVLMTKLIDRAQRCERRPVNFHEGPVPATQRLGLFEHVLHD